MSPASDEPADAPGTVLVVSAHPMFRRTFGAVVRSLGRACEALEDLGAGAPEDPEGGAGAALVVLDAGSDAPEEGIARLARARRALGDAVPIGAVIDHPDDAAVDALVGAGAAGVLVKAAPPTALVEALALLLAGGTCRPAPSVVVPPEGVPAAVRARLGARDQKMLRLIAGGRSVPAVAAELHLTPARVVADMRRIMDVVRGRA